ncbi:MAG: amino acid--tRNA ligase-related protein [Weeksellaceae bacterium]
MQQVISNPLGSVSQANEMALVPIVDPKKFSFVTNKMRTFFLAKGFLEVHTQNRLSILAACENPHSIASYDYCGNIWPLPQTGQMWLEYELLTQPDVPGYFCVSTSYRNEKDPIRGRHHRIFPMFEFELHGGIDTLIELEIELLEYLGFGNAVEFIHKNYEEMASKYQVSLIEAEHESQIYEDYGPIFFLENFPERTQPFWNMKRTGENAHKVDVLMHGVETIGSAERSCSAQDQRNSFYSIEEGKYAEKLFELFGKDRVEAELEDFLSHDFFPRSGGGMGIPRMIRAFELSDLFK